MAPFVSSLFVYLAYSTQYDEYGIEQIYESAQYGLNYRPNWYNTDRIVNSVNIDPYSTNQACSVRGNCQIQIDSSSGIIKMTGSASRYYCDVNHTNVEVTVYGKRGSEITPSPTQGLVIAARSDHIDYHINSCDAKSYYFKLYNSGPA